MPETRDEEIKRIVENRRRNAEIKRAEQIKKRNMTLAGIAGVVFGGIRFLTILMWSAYWLAAILMSVTSVINAKKEQRNITNPALPPSVLLVMTFGMFMGRLEFLVVIVTVMKLIDGWVKDLT